MTDEEFRAQHQPLHVPAHFKDARTFTDKVVFALADLAEANADEIVNHLEELEPDASIKPLIADTHRLLTALYEKGAISATDKNGDLIYNLHKITRPNDGAVNPDLLAPGLDQSPYPRRALPV